MPSFNLLPDGVTGTNNWLAPGFGGTACAAGNVDNDNDDTDYCQENAANGEITFTMAAPGVTEAGIASIDSVTVISKMRYTAGSGTTFIRTDLQGGGVTHTQDQYNVAAGSSYSTYTGDVETTRDGTNPWEYSHIEGLEVQFKKIVNAAARTEVRLSYFYVEVAYTAAAAGYGNNVLGVDSGDIATINGVATANISKVNGV